MKNFESLFTKVAEITDEFKQNLRYNDFEKSLTDLTDQYLAEHIQEVLETLMQDKWFISVLCSIAGKQCLSFEGYRLVSVSVLNDQRILVSTPAFTTGSGSGRRRGERSKGGVKAITLTATLD